MRLHASLFSGCLRGEDDVLVMVSEVEVVLPDHILLSIFHHILRVFCISVKEMLGKHVVCLSLTQTQFCFSLNCLGW